MERLALHQVPLTRLGHPARIVANIHASTLDYQMAHSNAVEVVKGIKTEVSEISRVHQDNIVVHPTDSQRVRLTPFSATSVEGRSRAKNAKQSGKR